MTGQEVPNRAAPSDGAGADEAVSRATPEAVRRILRRRLLLGSAAAVPLVVTLSRPRAALAQFMSVSCIEKLDLIRPEGVSKDNPMFVSADPSKNDLEELRVMLTGGDPDLDPAFDRLLSSAGFDCFASNGIRIIGA